MDEFKGLEFVKNCQPSIISRCTILDGRLRFFGYCWRVFARNSSLVWVRRDKSEVTKTQYAIHISKAKIFLKYWENFNNLRKYIFEGSSILVEFEVDKICMANDENKNIIVSGAIHILLRQKIGVSISELLP